MVYLTAVELQGGGRPGQCPDENRAQQEHMRPALELL
jgi:hypothetical protein